MSTITGSSPVASTPTNAPAGNVRKRGVVWESARIIWILARKEIRGSLRNRWLLFYTIAFAVLALGLSYMSLVGTGRLGFAGFGQTAAGLVNLVLLIVPLMGLTIGASSLASEQENGTLAYLIAQPIGRTEVLLGKYLGLGLSICASLAIGFGITAAVIASRAHGGSASAYLRIVGLAFLLSLAMLSVGMLISVLTRKTMVATGTAVFVWLTLVFLGDLGLMGGAIAFKLRADEIFHLALINPIQDYKMAAISGFDSSFDLLGPAGLYAIRQYGHWLMPMLVGALALWTIVPMLFAGLLLRRRPVS